LIIRNRDRVTGLTSAATVWAVASVGMACGAGLYVPAVFETVLVLVALEGVGVLERYANLKIYSVIYEVRGRDSDKISLCILNAMDRARHRFVGVEQQNIGQLNRLSFTLSTTRRGHDRLLADLNAAAVIDEVLTFRDPEDD
jgi:putative Mg2+ transporter-C (MgtC) family protein